jgi:hypothetical protein
MPFETESELLEPFKTAPKNSFLYSSSKSDAFVSENHPKYRKLHDRIMTLAEEVKVQDHPIILMILNSFPKATAEELNTLGEALIRVSKLLGPHNALEEQLSIVKYLREHPMLAASVFGEYDFENAQLLTEIESDL